MGFNRRLPLITQLKSAQRPFSQKSLTTPDRKVREIIKMRLQRTNWKKDSSKSRCLTLEGMLQCPRSSMNSVKSASKTVITFRVKRQQTGKNCQWHKAAHALNNSKLILQNTTVTPKPAPISTSPQPQIWIKKKQEAWCHLKTRSTLWRKRDHRPWPSGITSMVSRWADKFSTGTFIRFRM